MSRQWVVTGATGQVGTELVDLLRSHSATVVALGRGDLDITDGEAVHRTLSRIRPDVVVNAAAYTDVDGAESDADTARLVNAVGPGLLAAETAALGARLVHLSTDYVFSGQDHFGTPYDEDDPTDPLNVYGLTKRDGEVAVLAAAPNAWVVRTSWVYGAHGTNFVRTIRRLISARPTLDVVEDEFGAPTWTRDIATGIVELVEGAPEPGIYHASSAGSTSRHGQARAIAALTGADPDRIRPVPSEPGARPARRPAWSVLGHRRWGEAGLTPLPSWDVSLAAALRDPRL